MTERFLVAIVLSTAIATASAQDDQAERGRYLIHAGGCISCHTEDTDDAVPLAGGRAMETPFGTFYTPNITPDGETGIGGWSDDDFVAAFWEGVSPEGDHYFPAFPYTSYTGVSREDLLAMKVYLDSLDPVSKQSPDHDLAWYMSTRLAAGTWKALNFDAGRFEPDPGKDEQWNRGAYLVRHLGHCGECHTPRNWLGIPDSSREYAGAPLVEGEASAIDAEALEGWSEPDFAFFLFLGLKPDDEYVGGEMEPVIEYNTGPLTEEDRLALAAFFLRGQGQPGSN